MEEIKDMLKALLHAQEATHAKVVSMEDKFNIQFMKVNEEFSEVHRKLDALDSEVRSIQRQNRHMNTDIDSALDRIERIERTISQPPV